VLVSILSLLEDPNPDSPANVDASVAWRNDRERYNNTVRRESDFFCLVVRHEKVRLMNDDVGQVEKSKEDIPVGFKIPESEVYTAPPTEDVVDDSFWYEDADFDDDDNYFDACGDDDFGEDDDDEGVVDFDSNDEDVDMDDREGKFLRSAFKAC
jgi:ubiquitin-conjugating enzyme E2 R